MLKKVTGKHGEFVIFEHDLFVSRCLDMYGEWSEGEMDVYKHFIKPDMAVIEVGAHLGAFTVPLSKMCRALYTFEPQRKVFQVLNTNLMMNQCHNVYSYMAAVGEENKLMQFREVHYTSPTTKEGFNSGAVKVEQNETKKNGYPCPMVRLDDFIPEDTPVGFMKVDAEGMDLDVLLGAQNIISKYRPVIYVESNPGSSGFEAAIKGMGYRIFEHKPTGWSPDNFNKNPVQILKPRPGNIYDYMLLCIRDDKDIKTNLKEL